ncbi:hypothetical protein V5O48_013137 [Marasmius crinis-equi]|uniref:Mediator of RNA polymerase II transcription subunit 21 n=1 Tax=Marasmius crinis-equi TaxID=585013 RepID=A0ABR3F0Y1_9AGAR
MSSSIKYLTSRSNFLQVSPEIPITKQRNPEKYDSADILEENTKELVQDLIVKAKQVECLIDSFPEPALESEQAHRLQQLEDDMQRANLDYIQAINRAESLHLQVAQLSRLMLHEACVAPS